MKVVSLFGYTQPTAALRSAGNEALLPVPLFIY
jgi:hypothetical protein